MPLSPALPLMTVWLTFSPLENLQSFLSIFWVPDWLVFHFSSPIPKTSSMNLNSNHSLGELGTKAAKLEQDIIGRSLQENEYPKSDLIRREESISNSRRAETEYNRRLTIINAPNSVSGSPCPQIDDESFCSTSSISPAPLCRQFWKAGNYDDKLISKPIRQSTFSIWQSKLILVSNDLKPNWYSCLNAYLLRGSH